MKKLILAATALAMTVAFATTASAQGLNTDYTKVEFVDLNKDGMVSKEEFLMAMGKTYDAKMDAMKKMNAADQAKMIKADQMTREGYLAMWRQLTGGQ
jgi:predicted secreted protein